MPDDKQQPPGEASPMEFSVCVRVCVGCVCVCVCVCVSEQLYCLSRGHG